MVFRVILPSTSCATQVGPARAIAGNGVGAPVSATAESLFQSLFQTLSTTASAASVGTPHPSMPPDASSSPKTSDPRSGRTNSDPEDAAQNSNVTVPSTDVAPSNVLPVFFSFSVQPQLLPSFVQSNQNEPSTGTDGITAAFVQGGEAPSASVGATPAKSTYETQNIAGLNYMLQLGSTNVLPMQNPNGVPIQDGISNATDIGAVDNIQGQNVSANPPGEAATNQQAALTVPVLTISVRSSSPVQKDALQVSSVADRPVTRTSQDLQPITATPRPEQPISVAQLPTSSEDPAAATTPALPAPANIESAVHASETSPSLALVESAPKSSGSDIPENKVLTLGTAAVTESNTAASDVVLSPVTPSKFASAAGDSNQMSGGDEDSSKQPFAFDVQSSLITPLASPENTRGTHTSSAASSNEYVSTPESESRSSTTPLNEIRLQVDGNSNQQVSIRLVQQGDGIRVVLQSNDARLAQTLREQAPELTARLEQHQYQADVSLPNIHAARHFSEPNAAKDSGGSGDSSGNQTFGNQRNPHDRDRQQSRQEHQDEQDDFAALLGKRR